MTGKQTENTGKTGNTSNTSTTSTTIDLRGLVCPEPVLRTKKILDDASVEKVEALVESEVNVNNLERLARSLKATIESRMEGDAYRVTISRGQNKSAQPEHNHNPISTATKSVSASAPQAVGTVLFLSKDTFGQGDPDFSQNLLNMFLQTVLQSGQKPRAILLANTGVKLMDPEGSTLKVLNEFKDQGVEVLACGLCVEFYGLKDKIPTNQITNMYAISEYLFAADKVLSP